MRETVEYHPYYSRYINRVKEESLVPSLANGMLTTSAFFESIPVQKLEYRYAKGKWTPKEVLQHLIDTERVFSYRGLFIARATKANLAGMDQDDFNDNSAANVKRLDELIEEYIAVRTATITLFKNFDEKALSKIGVASSTDLSVRAAGYIISGHELHHCQIIEERYLS